jgi:hypothetical protein
VPWNYLQDLQSNFSKKITSFFPQEALDNLE